MPATTADPSITGFEELTEALRKVEEAIDNARREWARKLGSDRINEGDPDG